MLKKFLFSLFSIILLSVSMGVSFAQEADTPETPQVILDSGITLSPGPENINGNTPFVEITFNGLEDGDWYHCSIINEGCEKAEETIDVSGGTATVKVCAANDRKLRVNDCDDNDYFHEGKTYQFTLYEDKDKKTRGPSVIFYVNHALPDVTVTGNTGEALEIVVSGDRRPGPSKNKSRNNYQIVVEGKDKWGNSVKDDRCVTIEENGGSATARIGRKDNDESKPLNTGIYTVKINEQINEGGLRGALDSCSGGFTYWKIDVKIGEDGSMEPLQISCKGSAEGNPRECDSDPNYSDVKGLNELLKKLGEVDDFTLLCSKVKLNNEGKFECLEIDTAIGSIPTNPIAFIERLFSIVLSLAGVGALGLLIYGGYNYMVSQGDPEKIKSARETITSAIIGLLFIIFSLVILQVIAGDILNIPGFN